MTIDEIGKKHFPCECDEIYLSRKLTAPDCPYHAFDWESAMTEYAKQELILFIEWLYADERRFEDSGESNKLAELYLLSKK